MIAKIKAIKVMKSVAFVISGIDCTRVVICLLRLGLAFIVLSGLITLRVLKAFILISKERSSMKLKFFHC